MSTAAAYAGERHGNAARVPPGAAQRQGDAEAWSTLFTVADLVATDPARLGAVLQARPGSARDAWIAALAARLGTPLRKVPLGVGTDRLLGGLDLAATLRLRRPVLERGLLAQIDGGVALIPMAERMSPETVAHLVAAHDREEVVLERDGLAARLPARFGMIALHESDEELAPALADRLAFRVCLDALRPPAVAENTPAKRILRARKLLPRVGCDEDVVAALVEAADRLGVRSVRPVLMALAASRAAAALAGRTAVSKADAALGAALVLLPRATCIPAAPEAPAAEPEPGEDVTRADGGMADSIVEAALAALPTGLLGGTDRPARGNAERGAGAGQASKLRGRPLGVRAGCARNARVSLLETLKAAAPWQRARQDGGSQRFVVAPEDIRIRRFRDRRQTVTIFVVDASGSVARARLAEAKGAVELLLGEAYSRRDLVALVAFRGTGAELLLPPTRSLARAKRLLAQLPGGGGTPLAAGLDVAERLADTAARKGQTAAVVLLGDGRANVARSGAGDRAVARQEALAAARRLRAVRTVVVDTSRQAGAEAQALADAAGGRYVWLPRVDAAAIRATSLM